MSSMKYERFDKNAMKKRVRKCTIDWSTELSIELIEYVKNHENIWDPFGKFYKNREINDKSWNLIANALDISKNEAILRWNAIRGNYHTFLKKTNDDKSLDGAKPARRPNPIFAEMKFLDSILLRDLNPSTDAKSELDTRLTKEIDPIFTPAKLSGSLQKNYLKIRDLKRSSKVSPELDDEKSESSDFSNNLSLDSPIPKRQRKSFQQQNSLSSYNKNDVINMMNNAYEAMKNFNDEWEILGKMISLNARTWASEDLALARRYKAALSAVNAQFELEAANNTKNFLFKSDDPLDLG